MNRICMTIIYVDVMSGGFFMSKKMVVGTFNEKINKLLGTKIDSKSIYQSKGLQSHMMKSKHFSAIKYIDKIPIILSHPDYVGKSGSDDSPSIEYIKCFDQSIQLVVKIDKDNESLYIATMFDIPKKKIDRMLHSGRIIKYVDL